MTESKDISRITVHYVGRVQGVGFRYTVCRIAQPFDITGCVKNLANGSVELVAEGTNRDLTDLHQRICDEMKRNITNQEMIESSATGEFKSFDIAY